MMIDMREENLESCLEGFCVKCGEAADMVEEWWLDFLYLMGTCPSCGYRNHKLVKKA